MKVFDVRASMILYNILLSLREHKSGFRNKHFLLPLNVCPVIPAVFLKARINFKFIDISLTNFCLDEDVLLESVKNDSSVGGLLFVKTFGIDLDATNTYRKIKDINGDLFIIDDCCLCPPDFEYEIDNSIADAAIFSTGYSKYVDIGWGGFGFLKDEYKYIKQQIPFNKNHLNLLTESINKSLLNDSSFQYRDNDWLGAEAFLYDAFDQYKEQIKHHLHKAKEHKKLLNEIYSSQLPDAIQVGHEFCNWRFPIFVDSNKKLIDEIFNSGLFASSHYKDISFMFTENHNESKSNAANIHSRIVNLFNDFRFSENDAHKVVKLIVCHIEKEGSN